jgi:2TM domain
MSRIDDNRPAGVDPARAPSGDPGDELVRREAIRQVERKRRFHVEVVVSAVGMLVLVIIWAAAEYHNAGGWPSHGFSQSSGIHDEWNYWIVYPLGAWILILAARAWHVYGRKPVSESEIQREIDRMSGRR